jgi:DNA-binding MarR family transcriptional regulator
MDGNGVSVGVGMIPQSMNEVLQQLEATGLVERQPSPSNARILNAQLTQTAERKWQSVNDDVLELEERLLRGLSREEVRALNRALETIIRNMTPMP